jgi:hypothetical protein
MEIKEAKCPLGAVCEEVKKDGKIYRCPWYTKLQGKDPLSDKIFDEWKCAIAWLPIIMLENAQTNRGQTEVLSAMREESLNRQNAAISAIMKGLPNATIINN